ncbi:hypothetical protein OG216_46805 (plasmid) [Streptomycetaceae bacterium NBC_01309]
MNHPAISSRFLKSEQFVAARAWAALLCWSAARGAVSVGMLVSALVWLAPWWAAISRPAASGAALVCVAGAVLVRDACRWAGDVLAPPACAPSADLHYREYAAASVPCACGHSAAPADTPARRIHRIRRPT